MTHWFKGYQRKKIRSETKRIAAYFELYFRQAFQKVKNEAFHFIT